HRRHPFGRRARNAHRLERLRRDPRAAHRGTRVERPAARAGHRQYRRGAPVTRTLALLLAAATLPAVPATAQTPPAASAQTFAPLFATEVERARRDVDASIKAGIN